MQIWLTNPTMQFCAFDRCEHKTIINKCLICRSDCYVATLQSTPLDIGIKASPSPTHQCTLQTLCGVLHLVLDLWQQSLQLLHLLPLIWQRLWALSLVQQLLQFVCQTGWECLHPNNFKALIIPVATLTVWKPSPLTQPAPDDRDGALQLLDGLAVLEIQAVGQT